MSLRTAHYVPESVPEISPKYNMEGLQSPQNIYLHIRDEKTKAQRERVTCPGHTASKCQHQL